MTNGLAGLHYWKLLPGWELLREVLPSRREATHDLDALVTVGRKNSGLLPDDPADDVLRVLDTDELSRRRFLRSWQSSQDGPFSNLGPRWGPALALYQHLLPCKSAEVFSRWAALLRIGEHRSSKALAATLKELTTVAKKHGDLAFPGCWKQLVNLELLGGYLPVVPLNTFIDELRNWATGEILHGMPRETGPPDASDFIKVFAAGIREFLSLAPGVEAANRNAMTIRMFAKEPGLWMRAGSSHSKFSLHYTTSDGKVYKPKRSKANSALATPWRLVASIVSEDNPVRLVQHNTAIEKREGGKVRAVVNSDDETYLRMTYVSTWLEAALNGHPLSTLFMGSGQQQKLWERMAGNCSHDSVKMPIDQSHFDWQPNRAMLGVVVDEIMRFIFTSATTTVNLPDPSGVGERSGSPRADLLHVCRQIKTSIAEVNGSMKVGEGVNAKYIEITKGVMSGWRWTALIDTLCNYGELHCAREVLRRRGFRDAVLNVNVQGDDDQLEVTNFGFAAALADAYKEVNLVVNPAKFFTDTTRDEYLRQVATREGTAGYPARGLLSVCWRNPISRDPPRGALRVREQLKQWSTLINRGLDAAKCWKLFRADVCGANAIRADDLDKLLVTPACAGGLGVLWQPTCESWLSIAPGRVVRKVKLDRSEIVGLDDEVRRWHALGADFSDSALDAELLERLEVTEGGVVIEPGRLKPVATWSALPAAFGCTSSTGVPLSGRPRPGLPLVLPGLALEQAIRERRLDWVRDVWLDPALRGASDMIEQHGGRSVWFDWLTGRLPFSQPNPEGWSDSYVAYVHSTAATGAWSLVASRHSFTYLDVKRAALSAELTTRNTLECTSVRVGG